MPMKKGREAFPYEYIRWDISRNLSEVIRLIHENRIQIESLISEVCPLDQAQGLFDKVKKQRAELYRGCFVI